MLDGSSGEMFIALAKQFYPMIESSIPDVVKTVSDKIVEYIDGVAKQYGKEEVKMLMENMVYQEQKISVIKFMCVENGKLEPLLHDGKPLQVLTSQFMKQLIDSGVSMMNKE